MYQIKIFIFNYLKRIKINNLFDAFYNSINSGDFIFLRHLFLNNTYNERINFNDIHEIHNIIVSYIISLILM